MKTTPQKKRRGRPNRAAASAKALAGIDLAVIDPLAVLRSIAADKTAPASARVAAAKALLPARPHAGADDGAIPPALDTASAVAVRLVGRRLH
jgi:hypothetical protein